MYVSNLGLSFFLFSTEPKHKKYFVQMYYLYRIVERGVDDNKSVAIINIADVSRNITSVKSRHDNDTCEDYLDL